MPVRICGAGGSSGSGKVFINGQESRCIVNLERCIDKRSFGASTGITFSCGNVVGVEYEDEMYLMGGRLNGGNYTKYFYGLGFDAVNGITLKSKSSLPCYICSAGAVSYKGCLHLIGGERASSADSSTNTYYNNHYIWNGSSWTNIASASGLAETSIGAGDVNNAVAIFNDEIHCIHKGKHIAYDGTSWRSVSELPWSDYDLNVVVYNNELHCLSGKNYGSYHYKWNGSSWTQVSSVPGTHGQGRAFVFDGKLYIAGGTAAYTGYAVDNVHFWNGSSWTQDSVLGMYFCASPIIKRKDGSVVLFGSNSGEYNGDLDKAVIFGAWYDLISVEE